MNSSSSSKREKIPKEYAKLLAQTMERTRCLAVYRLGSAKQQEQEAKELTTTALRLPNSLKHIETSTTEEKKYAFDQDFVE
ncbi:hypothetical protein BDF14DRAFT_316010 [Spinellus fusiger]|nr:hypothetical protein BDF14DRAFT_316010 [Spinellus fusiger]